MEAEGEPQETRGKITRTFGEITFNSKFDSGNLDKVEEVHSDAPGRHCFNLWTAPDCAGTQYENGNRSWFYFSVAFQLVQETGRHCHTIRICLMNLNRQMRLYQQGLTPLVKTVPGKGGWERMRERPLCEMGEEGMTLTFEYSPPEANGRQQQQRHLVYFAFCFPYSYSECQRYLGRVDKRMKPLPQQHLFPSSSTTITNTTSNSDTTTNAVNKDSIYYHRQLLCYSLDGLRIDLLTISSHHGITMETEPRLPGLFPDPTTNRARIFKNKKIVFITSRVHPGETPSSYVFNGFLEFILNQDDPRSRTLREHFVFKMIPILNPDGVYRGHYRTDSRGVNLNRVYINPKWDLHPSVFCVRSLIMYYHMGVVSPRHGNDSEHDASPPTCECAPLHASKSKEEGNVISYGDDLVNEKLSKFKGNVAVYVDLHAHATKRGCFMYGNHFSLDSDHAECMLLPKLVSLNSVHFDFSHCVFSERNMCAFDKREDVVGKEGSGRVAIYKATGLLQSYTLECNYNSGARMNGLTMASMDGGRATPPSEPSVIPYRYTPSNYTEVGRGLAIAVLDLYQLNPWSRLHSTPYSTLNGLRQSLLQTVQENREKSEQAKSRSRLFPKQSNLSNRSSGSKTNISPAATAAAANGTTTTNNTTSSLHLDIVTNDQELPTACHISGGRGTPSITLCSNRKSTNTDRQMNTDRVLLRRHTSPSLLIRPQSSHKFIYSSSYPYIFNSSSGNFKQTLPPALAQNGIGGGCIVSDLTRSIRLPTVSSTNQQHPVHHTLFRAIKKQNTAPNKDGLAITGCESLNLLNKFTVIGRKVASSNSYCAGLTVVDKETNDELQLSEDKQQPPKIGQLKTSNPLKRIKKSSPSHTTSKGKQKKFVTQGGVATVRGKTRKTHPFSPTSRDPSSPTTALKDNPRPVAQVVSTGRRK